MSTTAPTTSIAKPINQVVKTTFASGVALPASTTEKVKSMPTKVAGKSTSKPKTAANPATKAVAKAPAKAVTPAAAAVPAKPMVKATAKKAAAKAPVTPKLPKSLKTLKVAKVPKAKQAKMVRDSMTMPKAEYAVIDELKLRAAKLDRPVKKTELLRAGIKALAAMADTGFLVALKAVPSLKTGRPNKN